MSDIRWVRADNPSSMTLDGTRTYIVGKKQVAVIDPGPLLPAHLDAVADTVSSGVSVCVLLTHTHPDHAGGANALAQKLGTAVHEAADGDDIPTDAGVLSVLATPGHTSDHVSFWHGSSRSLFCGDLMMGGLDTALVAPPEGDLQQYLDSLELIRSLNPDVIYPAHGEPIRDPGAALQRYIEHRMQRVEQVVHALQHGPQTAHELVDRIYGSAIDATLRDYAAAAVEAYLIFLENAQQVAMQGGRWRLA